MWALALTALLVIASGFAQADGKDPDRLYADREQLASARQAADIWDARLAANPKDFESAWKLARACYWLGGHVPANEQRQQYERGIKAATRAMELQPERPEGHFWMAADMGAMAESFGLRAGIRYRGPIKKALETVLKIDPAYQQGSADRALGRWYFQSASLVRRQQGQSDRTPEAVADATRPEEHAPRISSSPKHISTWTGRMMPAARRSWCSMRRFDPDWTPEDREFKQKAKELLEKIK